MGEYIGQQFKLNIENQNKLTKAKSNQVKRVNTLVNGPSYNSSRSKCYLPTP